RWWRPARRRRDLRVGRRRLYRPRRRTWQQDDGESRRTDRLPGGHACGRLLVGVGNVRGDDRRGRESADDHVHTDLRRAQWTGALSAGPEPLNSDLAQRSGEEVEPPKRGVATPGRF